MNTLLAATDLSARSDRAVDRAIQIARERGMRLVVAHVIDEDLPAAAAEAIHAVAVERIGAQLAAAADGPEAEMRIERGKAFAEIVRLAAAEDAEIVVLGTHRSDLLQDLFRGTTVERIIRTSPVPALVVRERPEGRPYRRAVVGLDFSVCSRRALHLAVDLVREGEIHFVHAYDVPFGGFIRGEGARREVAEAHEAKMSRLIDEEMAACLSGIGREIPEHRRILRQGDVVSVLLEQVRSLEADLLVLGTHGRTGVAHAVLGSVAEHLLRDPPCDMLAVKAW